MITRRDFTKYLSAMPLFGLSLGSKVVTKDNIDDGMFFMIYPDNHKYIEKFSDIFCKYTLEYSSSRILSLEECYQLDSTVIRPLNKDNFVRIHWLVEDTKSTIHRTKIVRAFGELREYCEDIKMCQWSQKCIDDTLNILKNKNPRRYNAS